MTHTVERAPLAPPRIASRTGAYLTAAAVAGVALWASAAPTMLYPLYAAQWHLTEVVTTSVFATYPLALVATLLLFGDLSDHIGRRATMLAGLGGLLIGSVLFAVAPSVGVLFGGRAFMGVGVGLALSPASAAVLEFSRAGTERLAGPVTTAATAIGLSAATIVSGALIQYADHPLHLSFWVLTVTVLAVMAAAWRLPARGPGHAATAWRPRRPHVPAEIRGAYVVSALAVSVAYMFGSIVLALGAQIAEELIHTRNTLAVGVVLAIMSASIGVFAITFRRVEPSRSVVAGAVVAAVAVGTLVAAANIGSIAFFVSTMVVAGTAYALLFSGGLGVINRSAPAHHRAGAISAVYLVAYVLQGVAAVTFGTIATNAGLETALHIAAPSIAGFAAVLVATTLTWRTRAGAVSARKTNAGD